MVANKSLLSCIGLIVLATSCTNDMAPEISYGLIRISVTTTGGDLDNRYEVLVGADRRDLLPNSAFTLTTKPGPATVELTNVDGNCQVQGSPSVTVDVQRAQTASVVFRVTCFATGFQISVRTAGEDTPNSFTLNMTGRNPMTVGVNADLLITRLQPGAYVVGFKSPIATCRATGPQEVNVELPPLTVVPVKLEVACTPPVRSEKIAYQLDSTYLAVARPDGSEQTIIEEGFSPSWSPNGKLIAYAGVWCSVDDYYYDYGCYPVVRSIDPETLNVQYIGEGSMPAWSPKDNTVALIKPNGSLQIAIANGPGSTILTLPAGLQAADPAWSPDATAIAFACHTPFGFSRLCIINRDGSGFRQLTPDTSDPAVHPLWSRDGTTIVFASIGVQETSIATIPAEGGAITKLVEGFDPAWSRDGTKLIFARSDGLFTMNADGSDVQRLTSGRHRAPAWRP